MMLTALLGMSLNYFAHAQASVEPGDDCLISYFHKLSDTPILCQGPGVGCIEIICP